MSRYLAMVLSGLLLAQGAMADMEPMTALSGNSVPLTMTMVIEQQTCELNLMTEETVSFIAVTPRDIKSGVPGPVARLAPKTISLNLTKCGSSERVGATPAIQVLGNNPFSGAADVIFRDDTSTVNGDIGFGLRYQNASGVAGPYLKNMDFVDLTDAPGQAAHDGTQNFLVDMYYGGGAVSAGILQASLRFRFMYH